MQPFPPVATWQHRDARQGFEVVFFAPAGDGWEVRGVTSATEAGEAFVVHYLIRLDNHWCTTFARVSNATVDGDREIVIEGDGAGRWTIDGQPASHLDGCRDVDLESSACTNAFPVRRMKLQPGASSSAPAVYVRAMTLSVDRLEQNYARIDDNQANQRFDYQSPAFDFRCELIYDECGLVLDYPGIATRIS